MRISQWICLYVIDEAIIHGSPKYIMIYTDSSKSCSLAKIVNCDMLIRFHYKSWIMSDAHIEGGNVFGDYIAIHATVKYRSSEDIFGPMFGHSNSTVCLEGKRCEERCYQKFIVRFHAQWMLTECPLEWELRLFSLVPPKFPLEVTFHVPRRARPCIDRVWRTRGVIITPAVAGLFSFPLLLKGSRIYKHFCRLSEE